jgi:hypothetical protein
MRGRTEVAQIKVQDIFVGRTYLGADGEIRQVKRIFKHYGGVTLVDWASLNRRARGRVATGQTSPELFAKWAEREMLPENGMLSDEETS